MNDNKVKLAIKAIERICSESLEQETPWDVFVNAISRQIHVESYFLNIPIAEVCEEKKIRISKKKNK